MNKYESKVLSTLTMYILYSHLFFPIVNLVIGCNWTTFDGPYYTHYTLNDVKHNLINFSEDV